MVAVGLTLCALLSGWIAVIHARAREWWSVAVWAAGATLWVALAYAALVVDAAITKAGA